MPVSYTHLDVFIVIGVHVFRHFNRHIDIGHVGWRRFLLPGGDHVAEYLNQIFLIQRVNHLPLAGQVCADFSIQPREHLIRFEMIFADEMCVFIKILQRCGKKIHLGLRAFAAAFDRTNRWRGKYKYHILLEQQRFIDGIMIDSWRDDGK